MISHPSPTTCLLLPKVDLLSYVCCAWTDVKMNSHGLSTRSVMAGIWESEPTLASLTKYHGGGGLNNRHVFLTVLQSGKSKIKVLAGFSSW